MPDPAVRVDNLVVRYGALVAVDGVSFSAEAGRVTAVLGPNGAGKTSTIEVCEGFRSAAEGSVQVLGLDPARDQRRLAERMGVMLQEGGVYPSARVADVVQLFCALHDNKEQPGALLEMVSLGSRARSTWRRLSGGERQRLSLALALAARPDVAFLDEPTSGVDVNGRVDIRNIISGLAERGCCVVLATHELDEAERVADHVVVFDRGRVVADGSLDGLRGSTRRIRFRLPVGADAPDFASLAVPVVREGEWFEIADSSAAMVARLTALLESAGTEAVDLRVGQASLEDVFRRLTRPEAS